MQIKKIALRKNNNQKGLLVYVEETDDIPFLIKRVYYIVDVPENTERGFHAHKDLEQVLICPKGSCKITLDDGLTTETIDLNSPTIGLYVPNNVWRIMSDFSSDCVLLVLASKEYDENDYIRNYDDFIDYIERGNDGC